MLNVIGGEDVVFELIFLCVWTIVVEKGGGASISRSADVLNTCWG